MLGDWRRVAPAVAATVLLWGCATPAVETDAPDYSTTAYVYDVSLCNAADLVRNPAEGTVEIAKGAATTGPNNWPATASTTRVSTVANVDTGRA